MKIQVLPVDLDKILPFRDLYRQELNCQIVHDSAYRKDCFQIFSLQVEGEIAGYGSTWIGPYWMPKGSVFEFYVTPCHRSCLFGLFEKFLQVVRPPKIYAQTNDSFLGILIYDYTETIVVEHILFKDWKLTQHATESTVFRRTIPDDQDRIFKHHVEPVGDWLLESDGKIVATGGIGFHYNRPYGDLFMEVDEPFRRRGFGQFLVQELKKVCYQAGSIPAARCKPVNVASRRTLEQAGFAPCGRLIFGETA